MRYLFGFFLIVFQSIAYGQYLAPRSVVYPIAVDFTGAQRGGGFGSTVLIMENRFLSSAHSIPLVDGGKVIYTINTRDGKVTAKVIKIDRENDLVVLEAPAKCPCATLDTEQPGLDDPVIAVGYPWGGDVKLQFVTEGRYQGIFDGKFLATTAPVAPGSSGGGLFRKNLLGKWVLTGITAGINSGDGNRSGFTYWISYYVPASTIQKFLTSP